MTTSKKLNPAAIIALKEALTHIYWYNNDLRSFLVNTLSNPSIPSTVNWDTAKRNIIDAVVETLARNEKKYQDELLRLFTAVASIPSSFHQISSNKNMRNFFNTIRHKCAYNVDS